MTPSWKFTPIPYHSLPHQPAVFLKYAGLSEDILPFYQRRPTLHALLEAAPEISSLSFPRPELAECLLAQNERFGMSGAVRAAIANLSKPGSVAVLTGQQTGLFTGPALTIYKALTALRLRDHLMRQGINAAAVFWLASDDHDLEEITRLAIPQPEGGVRMVDARRPLFGASQMPPLPVGSIRLPSTIEPVIDEYCSSVAEGPREQLRGVLAHAYRSGASFADAFGRLMAGLLKERGLILFDPRDAGAKRLSAPVLKRAVEDARILRTNLIERNGALLDIGLNPQVAVLPRSTLVFLEDGGERRLLAADGDGFVLKDTRRRYSLHEVLDLLDREPERFSPNVLLRPIVQDHLFPTVAYVGGPAEVSYFAQAAFLYQHYGRPAPVIWPRAGFTILDAAAEAAMSRFGLRVEDCFEDPAVLVRKILALQPGPAERLLANTKELINVALRDLRPALVQVEGSLGPASDTIRRKLLHRTASLETNIHHIALNRNSTLRREITHLLDCVCPNGTLQERLTGFPLLAAQHGPALLDALAEAIDLDSPTHVIAHPV